jgi:hypothetical protein
MAEAWKGEVPSHPGLDAMPGLKASLDGLPTPDAAVLQHAAQWVGTRFEEEKRRRAEMGFDDMLLRLDAALQSDGGERLATLIREQFPVALIDEFQDTDPVRSVPDRRPQASDLRIPRCRHLHLPACSPGHRWTTAYPGYEFPFQPWHGQCGKPCVRACRVS